MTNHLSADPVEALAARAEAAPDLPAVITPDVELTAAELWDSARRIAVWFEEQGIQEGERLAISLPAPLESAFAIGALLHGAVGCVAVPGMRVGESAPVQRVISARHVAAAEPARTTLVDHAVLARLATLDPEDAPVRPRDPHALARIVHSSGTTGAPKAVGFSRELLRRRVDAARSAWITDERFMSLLGPASMSAQVAFLHALEAGTPYLAPGTAAQNLEMLRAQRVQVAKGSPQQWRALLDAARRSGERLPELAVAQTAGAPMSGSLASELTEWFGVQIRVLYGATEAGTVVVGDGVQTGGPLGRVLPHVTVEIEEEGRAVPDGIEGHVRIRTDGLALGYLGVADDQGAGLAGGWFRPGDRGFLRAGELHLVGRADELVNAAGVQVRPERVEELAYEVAGVEDACAGAVVDQRGMKQVALAYVGDLGDPDAALASLRAALGDAAPRIVVRVAALPRTATGKLRRAEVAADIERRVQSRIEL